MHVCSKRRHRVPVGHSRLSEPTPLACALDRRWGQLCVAAVHRRSQDRVPYDPYFVFEDYNPSFPHSGRTHIEPRTSSALSSSQKTPKADDGLFAPVVSTCVRVIVLENSGFRCANPFRARPLRWRRAPKTKRHGGPVTPEPQSIVDIGDSIHRAGGAVDRPSS